MSETLLPQPSLTGPELRQALGSHILIDGDPPGIIATDPMAIQCASCGLVAQQDMRSWTAFLLCSGFQFHICTKGAEGRLCRDCVTAVRRACPSSRCGS